MTADVNCWQRQLPQRLNERARRMGPGVRRDDDGFVFASTNRRATVDDDGLSGHERAGA